MCCDVILKCFEKSDESESTEILTIRIIVLDCTAVAAHPKNDPRNIIAPTAIMT